LEYGSKERKTFRRASGYTPEENVVFSKPEAGAKAQRLGEEFVLKRKAEKRKAGRRKAEKMDKDVESDEEV